MTCTCSRRDAQTERRGRRASPGDGEARTRTRRSAADAGLTRIHRGPWCDWRALMTECHPAAEDSILSRDLFTARRRAPARCEPVMRSRLCSMTQTATAASACTPPPRSSTAPPARSATSAGRPCTPPTWPTPPGSGTASLNHPRSRRRLDQPTQPGGPHPEQLPRLSQPSPASSTQHEGPQSRGVCRSTPDCSWGAW